MFESVVTIQVIFITDSSQMVTVIEIIIWTTGCQKLVKKSQTLERAFNLQVYSIKISCKCKFEKLEPENV